MADLSIDALILSEHDQFRRAFADLEGQEGEALATGWRELADALEVHAAGEEEVFYPHLLREVDDSEGETKHAVKDHNEIRDACRTVDDHEVGTDAWWEAFREAREATVEHLEEEEHDVLPPFKSEVDEAKRTQLGEEWLAFLERHQGAKGLDGEDVDPEEYVEEHSS